jgi:very-short-patch-repair endonuclease
MAKKKVKKDYKKLLAELNIAHIDRMLPTRSNPNATEIQRERTLDLRIRATSAETYADQLLQQSTINYVFQKVIENPFSYYIVDFFFPDTNTILELDGKYHNKLIQYKKDVKRDAYLKEVGFTIIRMKNRDVYKRGIKWFKKIANRKIPKTPNLSKSLTYN